MPSQTQLITLGIGLLMAAAIHYRLLVIHKKRRLSRAGIFNRLYGPGFFTSIFVFFALYTGLQTTSLSPYHGLLLAISIPSLLQLLVTLTMVSQAVHKQPRFKITSDRIPTTQPKVAVIFPTYKEPFEVARMTLDSITDMSYEGELKIIVIDNSSEYEDLQKWQDYVLEQRLALAHHRKDIHWISRDPDQKGYKPLNLDVAFQQQIAQDDDIDFILYVDTDSTFAESTLNELICEFEKTPEAGYIQLMTTANNMHINRLSKVTGIQQTIFRFVLGEIGNWGIPIFYGHNAIFRREVVEKVGSFLEKDNRNEFILTEDFSITIRSYLKGYYGKTHWLMSGEGVPTSLKALKGMWERWSIGGLQVLKKYALPTLRSKEINLFEKVSFLFHGLCYPSHALIPLLILISPLVPQFAVMVVAMIAINSLLSMIGFRQNFSHLLEKNEKASATDYILAFFTVNTYITWIMFRSTWKFIFNQLKPKQKLRMTWIVTPKGKERKQSKLSVFRTHLDILLYTSGFGALCYYSLLSGTLDNLVSIQLLPSAFFIGNLLLTIFVFGQSRRTNITQEQLESNIENPRKFSLSDQEPSPVAEMEIPTEELI